MTALNVTPRTATPAYRVEARHPTQGWMLLPWPFPTVEAAERYIDLHSGGLEHRIVPAGGSGLGNGGTTTHRRPERLTTR